MKEKFYLFDGVRLMGRIHVCFLLTVLFIIPYFLRGQFHFDESSVVKTDTGLYGIAISKNKTLVYDHYFNNKSASELFNDQSLTKSIMSILIGIAIDNGSISSLDEKISRFFLKSFKTPIKESKPLPSGRL